MEAIKWLAGPDKHLVEKVEENVTILLTMTLDYRYCSTTGKPTHLFRTKCVSLDSV